MLDLFLWRWHLTKFASKGNSGSGLWAVIERQPRHLASKARGTHWELINTLSRKSRLLKEGVSAKLQQQHFLVAIVLLELSGRSWLQYWIRSIIIQRPLFHQKRFRFINSRDWWGGIRYRIVEHHTSGFCQGWEQSGHTAWHLLPLINQFWPRLGRHYVLAKQWMTTRRNFKFSLVLTICPVPRDSIPSSHIFFSFDLALALACRAFIGFVEKSKAEFNVRLVGGGWSIATARRYTSHGYFPGRQAATTERELSQRWSPDDIFCRNAEGLGFSPLIWKCGHLARRKVALKKLRGSWLL